MFDQENPKLLALQKKVEDLEKSLKKVTPPTTLVMVEMDEKRDTHVMARGSYLSPKQKVEADVPEVLNDWKPEWPKNRLGLAKWLVDPENPPPHGWWLIVGGGSSLVPVLFPRKKILDPRANHPHIRNCSTGWQSNLWKMDGP